ncbi:MAG: hypothetical protein M3308_07275 [Actinomycetota bacterium]|nr:hypothetical protein [Actinomycetota bacterium]
MTTVWVAQLTVSLRTAQKIAQLHGITETEVRDSVQCVRGLYGRWDEDPERGLRALIDVVIRDRPATVVLYPAPHPMRDTWKLGSVYFVD